MKRLWAESEEICGSGNVINKSSLCLTDQLKLLRPPSLSSPLHIFSCSALKVQLCLKRVPCLSSAQSQGFVKDVKFRQLPCLLPVHQVSDVLYTIGAAVIKKGPSYTVVLVAGPITYRPLTH